jgi:hypothetical protein
MVRHLNAHIYHLAFIWVPLHSKCTFVFILIIPQFCLSHPWLRKSERDQSAPNFTMLCLDAIDPNHFSEIMPTYSTSLSFPSHPYKYHSTSSDLHQGVPFCSSCMLCLRSPAPRPTYLRFPATHLDLFILST